MLADFPIKKGYFAGEKREVFLDNYYVLTKISTVNFLRFITGRFHITAARFHFINVMKCFYECV